MNERREHHRRATVVLLVPATVALAGAAVLAQPLLARADGAGPPPPPAPLVELQPCAGAAPSTPPATTPSAPGSVSQTVTVTVPATVRVWLGADGQPRTVATNTGCTPRATDTFWVISGEQATPAGPALVQDLTGRTYHGDWTDPATRHQLDGSGPESS